MNPIFPRTISITRLPEPRSSLNPLDRRQQAHYTGHTYVSGDRDCFVTTLLCRDLRLLNSAISATSLLCEQLVPREEIHSVSLQWRSTE